MTINTFPPDNPMLILTMQMAFIAENVSIVLNLLLIFTFIYRVKKERKRLLSNKNGVIKTKINNNDKSNMSQSNSFKKGKPKDLNQETIYITYCLLFIGLIFSICQGLIENWLTKNCGAEWLQLLTFFFYAAHRAMLLFAFLHRLYFVFKNTAYEYPKWFYYILMILIILYFISSYIIYVFDHHVTPVHIKMYTGYSGDVLCSWSFGVLFSCIARPIEIALTLIIVIAFLCKLFIYLCQYLPVFV